MKKFIIASTVVLGGVAFAAFSANNGQKVTICHNNHLITVSVNAMPAHMAHGDAIGTCNADPM